MSQKTPAPVIILAAGRGSRFGANAIHKALLPIRGKPVIDYIVALFPKNPLVIAVGHLANQIEEYFEIRAFENRVQFVHVENFDGLGSGPGASLLACRTNVTGPFYTIACDTIVTDAIPPINRNWIGVAKVEEPGRFCTAEITQEQKVLSLADKSKLTKNRMAYIGLAGILDTAQFWESLERKKTLIENEHQVSSGLDALIAPGLFAHTFDWHDTGTPESLLATRNRLGDDGSDFSKSHEQTYVVDNSVIKWSDDSASIRRKHTRAQLLEGLVPPIRQTTQHFFRYDLVPGKTLYQCLNGLDFSTLLHWLNQTLWPRLELKPGQELEFREACDKFYRLKTRERVSKLSEKHLGEKDSTTWDILKRKTNHLLHQVDWNQFVTRAFPCRFHGDLNFGNMIGNLIASPNGSISLIDWREDFGGLSYGDQYYDLGKLLAGLWVNFDSIRSHGCPNFSINASGEPSVTYNTSPELTNLVTDLEQFCQVQVIDFTHVQLVAATTFLNMAPLHTAPLDSYFLAVGHCKLSEWLRNNRVNAPNGSPTT